MRPEESSAAWALRFVQDLPNVKMVLSGMARDAADGRKCKTFSEEKPLTYGEREKLLELAEGMKIPFRARPAAIAAVTARCSWTSWRCCLSIMNWFHLRGDHWVIRLDGLSEEKRSSACTPAESVRRSVLRTSTFRRL